MNDDVTTTIITKLTHEEEEEDDLGFLCGIIGEDSVEGEDVGDDKVSDDDDLGRFLVDCDGLLLIVFFGHKDEVGKYVL